LVGFKSEHYSFITLSATTSGADKITKPLSVTLAESNPSSTLFSSRNLPLLALNNRNYISAYSLNAVRMLNYFKY